MVIKKSPSNLFEEEMKHYNEMIRHHLNEAEIELSRCP